MATVPHKMVGLEIGLVWEDWLADMSLCYARNTVQRRCLCLNMKYRKTAITYHDMCVYIYVRMYVRTYVYKPLSKMYTDTYI